MTTGKMMFLAAVLTVSFLISIPVHAADPVGNWNFTLYDSSSSGPCPMGGDGKGTLSIAEEAGGYTIQYISGMACRPASVCTLAGACDGEKCTFSTTVPVDNEGGKVTNSAEIVFRTSNGSGSGSTVYNHPAMQCSWSYRLKLNR